MKRNRTMYSAIAVVLSLLLLLSAPAATAAELFACIPWDTTVEDMLALEGVPQGETRDGYEDGEFLQHGFLHFADGPHIRFIMYIFKTQQLVLYAESIYATMQDEGYSAVETYADILAGLITEYGEPTLLDKQRLIGAFNAIQESTLTEDYILLFSGWEIDESTTLYTLLMKPELGDNIMTVYINEARMLGE